MAGHSSLPCADYVNLSALPAIQHLRKTLVKTDGYAGQAAYDGLDARASSCEPHRRLQRRAAQKILRLHRRLAGALQLENPDCALLAGNREVIVEQFAGRA